jgi:hypothetical protein
VEELDRFEWDDDNLRHVLQESPHGITPVLCETLKNDRPKMFPNTARPGRSGSHVLVGVSDDRFWTVVLLNKGSGMWRPITGWPSTPSEIRLYNEEIDR